MEAVSHGKLSVFRQDISGDKLGKAVGTHSPWGNGWLAAQSIFSDICACGDGWDGEGNRLPGSIGYLRGVGSPMTRHSTIRKKNMAKMQIAIFVH